MNFKKDKLFGKRVLMSVLGMSICGVSVGFFKCAAFGVDPFQTFCFGINEAIPINYGTLYLIINAILLIFMLTCNRKLLGVTTFVNMFLLGYIVDFSKHVLQSITPDPGMGIRILYFVVGIFLICLSSSFYYTGDLGVSTYDVFALTMSDKWHLGQFRFCRIATDLVCVTVGTICFLVFNGSLKVLFASVGVGTIVTAFFMGPLVDFFIRKVSDPFLYGKEGKPAE